MLDNFPGYQTSDIEKAKDFMSSHFGVRGFECRSSEAPLILKANWAGTEDVKIISGSCNAETDAFYEEAHFVRQTFGMGTAGRIQYDVRGKTVDLSATNYSFLAPAGTSFRVRALPLHGLVGIRIENAALKKAAHALLGDDVSQEILFEHQIEDSNPLHRNMKQALVQFAEDLDLLGPNILESAKEEFAQTLVMRFLLYNLNNLSVKLRTTALAPSSSQILRIEEFIHANSNRPIDADELSRTFGISIRSVFRHFKKHRGVSPSEYVKKIRLSRARTLLENDDGNVGVIAIAMKCGFQSLGHFSRDYRQAFGELPSQTLRHARRSTQN